MSFVTNDQQLQVWTPSGWQPFHGVQCNGEQPVIRLVFDDGTDLTCTGRHVLYLSNGCSIRAEVLCVGDRIQGDDRLLRIVAIEDAGTQMVYDLVEVGGGHKYISGPAVSSNCSFISADATLISPQRLVGLADHLRAPRFVDRWGCRWYEEITPNTAYGVVLDPSEGVDADDAVIQVWAIPELKQVAEWHSNKADAPEQAKMLMRVLRRIYNMQSSDPDHFGDVNLYYSVERNGLGVSVLTAIEYEGESNFPGWLIDSTGNKSRGLLTTVGSKKFYGLELKSLVERGLFIPRSKHLVSQMKTFVKTGVGYKAKEGKKDDIIMSCILMCHLIEEVRYHEPDLDDRVRIEVAEHDPDDEEDPRNMALSILL